MIKYNPVTKESGDCIVVGRAATAIYLILSELKEKGKYVIVPANICYAAVFPILSAGLKPLFCDIDKYSGNITLESIKRGLKTDVIAAIIPHMYGNPVQDIELIQKELEKSNVILIEDCASLMSNIESTVMPGTVGDYVIYSTGYSKTIDLGFGGLLFSKSFSLVSIESHEVNIAYSQGNRAANADNRLMIYFQGMKVYVPDGFQADTLLKLLQTLKKL